MGLFVSTTGANIAIPELGITIAHPTTDRDMGSQFSSDEIEAAASLTTAIRSGSLVWRKLAAGAIQTATDYDEQYLVIADENTGSGAHNDQVVTFKDLSASVLPSKSGTVNAGSFSGNPKKYTVSFSIPFATSNYSVVVTGVDGRSWSIESKTAAGFVLNSRANQALTGDVNWIAILTGETT